MHQIPLRWRKRSSLIQKITAARVISWVFVTGMPAIQQLTNGRAGQRLGDDGLAVSAQIGKGYFSKAKSFPILKQRRGVDFSFQGLSVFCSTKYVSVTLQDAWIYICSLNLWRPLRPRLSLDTQRKTYMPSLTLTKRKLLQIVNLSDTHIKNGTTYNIISMFQAFLYCEDVTNITDIFIQDFTKRKCIAGFIPCQQNQNVEL